MATTTPELDSLEPCDARIYLQNSRRYVEVHNSEGDRAMMHNVGKGRHAFLICSGPSLNLLDLTLLNQRGIVTMGMNNSAVVYKPNFWACVDSARNFVEHIWKDATICKFAPSGHTGTKIRARTPDGVMIDSSFRVDDCPNVWFYRRNGKFEVDNWLTQKDFNWGNSEGVTDSLGNKGSRSVMLVALKLLWYLGFGTVYLIGADFKMELGEGIKNYAFDQMRSQHSVDSNNATYAALNSRLSALKPYFEKAGFNVYNATANSGLNAFDTISYEDAVAAAAKECNEKPILTEGYYDTK